MDIKTASWFTAMPPGHLKIGISRGVPRRMTAGYRLFRRLAPGRWFNSVDAQEYQRRYQADILDPLNPRIVADQLTDLVGGAVAVLVCFERAGSGQWCHRALAAEWLAESLGRPVPELGFETLRQEDHPLMPGQLPRRK
jgi:hypothetical protein